MKRRTEKYALRRVKAGFVPADEYTISRLREKNIRVGDIVFAELKKPRNPKFHALAHAFGKLVSENIENFSGMNPHKVLKRIQMEKNIGCEEIAFEMPGIGMLLQRIPRSLSFESMEEGEFHEIMRNMSRYVADRYWPDMTEKQIEEMAGVMIDE